MGAISGGVNFESVFADGSNGTGAFPDDADDVVWIQQLTFCVDASTFVFGGVSDDVGSLVLTSQNAEQVVLEVLDVPKEDWGAVVGEIPRSWRSLGSLRVEAISKHDGAVLASESY